MKIKKSKNISIQKISDSLFILNHETGKYLELNESSMRLWDSFKDITDTEKLTNFLSEKYNIDHVKAHEDVNEFIYAALKNRIFELISE